MAKRFFRTKTADRPDLAAIGSASQLDVMGYVFHRIFPLMPVTESSGTISVAKPGLTNSKGQKGRADGEEISTSTVTRQDINWSTARYEGRALQYEKDASAYETEEDADAAGAEEAQRLAWNKAEDTAFAKVFTAARKSGATTLADHAVVKTLQKKAKALRKFGKPTLVMTTNTWFDFVEIPEIRYRLEKLAGAGNDVGFIMTDLPKVRAAVSSFMQFNDILVFDSDIVDVGGTFDGCIAVIGLRPEAMDNAHRVAKAKAVYGWTPMYIPEGAPADKPFDMRSHYSDDKKANVYDAEAFFEPTEAFSAAVAMCKFADSYTEYAVPNVNVQQAPDGGGQGGGGVAG